MVGIYWIGWSVDPNEKKKPEIMENWQIKTALVVQIRNLDIMKEFKNRQQMSIKNNPIRP